MQNPSGIVDGNDTTKTSIPFSASRDPTQSTPSITTAARIAAQAASEIPFAQKLMNMINDGRFRGVVGWSADGESFSILKRDVFKSRVLPAYFGSIQLKSFKKRLSRHGFETRQIYTLGREDTAFFHPNFVRDRPELCVLIVPLGTTKISKKRLREEIENDSKPSSSSSPSSSNDNSLPADQPLSPPAFTATTASVEKQPQGQGQCNARKGDVSGAAASFCVSRHATAEATTTDQHPWSEPASKRICETPGVSMQDVSAMGAQVEDTEADGTIIRSNTSSKTLNVVHSEQVFRQDRSEEEHRDHTLTRRDPATHVEAAPPQDGVSPDINTPPQVLSSCPDVWRTLESEGRECKMTPDVQGEAESTSDDNGNEQRNECRAGNTTQKTNLCGGICASDIDVGRPRPEAPSAKQVLSHDHGRGPLHSTHSPSPSVNAAIIHTVQQQWLQIELQAAAMSAQAAFLRKLFLQISSTQGAAGILGGAFGSSSQQGSMEFFQQQLQLALGAVERDEGFLNGLSQQAANLNGLLGFPDGAQRQAGQSFNPHQQTSPPRTVNIGGQMSSAQDPVAVILDLASSLGLKFSS